MTVLLVAVTVLVWLLLIVGFWTGASHRWLRARGLARQPAAVIEAILLGTVFFAIWVLSDVARTPADQQWWYWIWQVLAAYAGVLLRLRLLRLT